MIIEKLGHLPIKIIMIVKVINNFFAGKYAQLVKYIKKCSNKNKKAKLYLNAKLEKRKKFLSYAS